MNVGPKHNRTCLFYFSLLLNFLFALFFCFRQQILSFMYLGKQVLCLLKVVVKGSSHRGVRGPRCYWQASLSDVSPVFIHYSSVEWWKHSTPASWTPPQPPRRLDTWPSSASALFATGQRTCREKTPGLLSLCFLTASWYSEGILCRFFLGRKLCYQMKEGKKKNKKHCCEDKLSWCIEWWFCVFYSLRKASLYRSPCSWLITIDK